MSTEEQDPPPRSESEEAPSPAHSRRSFLTTSTLATASLVVGCSESQGPPTTDSGLSDAALDGSMPDGDPPSPDASPDATPDAATDAGPPVDTDPTIFAELTDFPLGVASGDVTSTQAILWTRYDGRSPLTLRVWQYTDGRYLGPVYDGEVTPADGGFVHVDVDGLSGGTRYRYAFLTLEDGRPSGRSPIGSFRAALAPDALETVIIGASSCTKNGRSMATLQAAGAREDLDLYLLLGDTTYNDGATTRAQFREKWAENLSTEGYRAMRAATSVLATWDDHEVDNNFNPERTSSTLIQTARDAFFENLPLRRDDRSPNRIWKSMRWGQTVEVFVLDTRGERQPSTMFRSDTYISREQMDWLKDSLRSSPAVFKLIMNSVPIANFPLPFDFAAADRWEGYRTQRDEILRFIDDEVDGAFWVSGDFHLACIAQVESRGTASGQYEFLVGPGAQSANPLWNTLPGPQFLWRSGENNYTSFELRPRERELIVTWHAGDGRLLETRSFTL